MLRILLGSLLLATIPTQAQQLLTADQIMAHVAANQDAAEAARSHYLYTQHAHIASRKGKTIRCEETTDTRITPTPNGSNRQLLKLDGRLLQKHRYITYTELPKSDKPKVQPAAPKTSDIQSPPVQQPQATDQDDDKIEVHNDDIHISIDDDDTMDRDLVENMRGNLTAGHSKDGISANLFPLTSKEQAGYTFTLLGLEPRNGRDSFHIAFAPKDPDDYTWKGDAWIDTTAFQPIVVRTGMSRKLPLAVRLLLGTNVPGLGFTIVYAPQHTTNPSSQLATDPSSQPTANLSSQPTTNLSSRPTTNLSSRPEAALSAAAAERPAGSPTANPPPICHLDRRRRSLPPQWRDLQAAPPPPPTNPPAVWFPTSFGTEFKIHVLFFFSREIVFNAENRDFHQTHTTAEIREAPIN